MTLELANKYVQRAFSNSSDHYEAFAQMQYKIGCELVKELKGFSQGNGILDIGMGTGKLADYLSRFYPGASIVGVDFAEGMVQVAKRKYRDLKVVQADARALPFIEESFDVVVSNLVYQWVVDMSAAFVEARRVLEQGGWLFAALFGRKTLYELFESLENVASQCDRECKLQKLADEEMVRKAFCAAGFKDIVVRTEVIEIPFADAHSLLQWLKLTGANMLNHNFYFGPQYLRKMMQYYEENFKGRQGVTASFEVIWVKGRK